MSRPAAPHEALPERPPAWDRRFWTGRRVLVTGHTGFKGAWLCAWLQRLGARVTGFSLPAPAPESGIWRAIGPGLVEAGLQDTRGDLCEPGAVTAAVERADADVVLHLAAQAIVLDSYAQPVSTWGANVMGTLQVLQALAAHGRPAAFVGVTSDKCYENADPGRACVETDPLGGHDPYSASKAACEILLSSWRRSFSSASGIRVASARAGNVIGAGDDAPHRIVPDLVRAFAAGRPAQLRHPDSLRPYQHVLEPLSGYLLLAQGLCSQGERFAQAYNFGPRASDGRRTGALAEAAARHWGGTAEIRSEHAAPVHHESRALALDSSKARRELGWTPTWDAGQAISAAIDGYKALLRGAEAGAQEIHRQIACYERALAASR